MFNSNNKKGFSLIELIVAFSIIGVAFVSLIQAFPFGLSISKESENKTIASYLAQKKIEELLSLGYNDINTGTIENISHLSPDQSGPLYSYGRETVVSYVDGNLSDSAIDGGMKKIITTIHYPSGGIGSQKNLTISTLVSKN